jgi:DNA-binding NtrC family response regulator
MSPTVLVVEDEELLRLCLCAHLERRGYATRAAADGEQALAIVRETPPDVVVMDIEMPHMDGLMALRHMRAEVPDLPVILVTAHARLDGALKASRMGARAFLTKPFDLAEAAEAVARVLSEDRGRRRPELRVAEPGTFAALVGETDAVRDIRAVLGRIAVAEPPTVLLEGEAGTGKSLVAELIHRSGEQRNESFLEIDCAALPERVLETEIFGQWHGRDARRGAIEAVGAGTVVLDNVTAMPQALQSRLVRALEARSFRRDSGMVDIPLRCTILATTRKSLRAEVRAGRFREDLFYRLGLVTVSLPPLRDRATDVPLLVEMFLGRLNRDMRREVRGVTAGAMAMLQHHGWPGNVRELRSVLERSLVLFNGQSLGVADLPPELRDVEDAATENFPVELPDSGVDLAAMERGLVLQALGRARWNERAAAAMLGLSLDELVARMVRHEIPRPDEPARPTARTASVIPIGDREPRTAAAGFRPFRS